MKGYYDSQATFDNGKLVVTDKEVAEFTDKHMHPEDKKDIRRVVECAMYSFSILSKSVEPPMKEPWFYYDELEEQGDE